MFFWSNTDWLYGQALIILLSCESMRLELEVLDGENKGKRIALRSGLKLGKTVDFLSFDDEEMAETHAVLNYDSKKSWNIECLHPSVMRLGFEEVGRATLILGLVFHLGQTGFKVVEKPVKARGPWEEELKDWFENYPARSASTEIFFFLHPVRLTFIQGPQ